MRLYCRSLLVTLSIGVGLLGWPSSALPHAGNTNPSDIHACVANATKDVRIVGLAGTCVTAPQSKAETPIHWAGPAQAAGGAIEGGVSCGTSSVAHGFVYIPGRSFSVVTDDAGLFRLDAVPAGTYEMRIEIPNSQAFVVPTVAVIAGQVTNLGVLAACPHSDPTAVSGVYIVKPDGQPDGDPIFFSCNGTVAVDTHMFTFEAFADGTLNVRNNGFPAITMTGLVTGIGSVTGLGFSAAAQTPDQSFTLSGTFDEGLGILKGTLGIKFFGGACLPQLIGITGTKQ
jgi:Carboxypeptidase regulatory-like domain